MHSHKKQLYHCCPSLSFLKSLYASMVAHQSCKLSHCISDIHEFVALQLHADFWCFLCVLHVACVSVQTLQRNNESYWFIPQKPENFLPIVFFSPLPFWCEHTWVKPISVVLFVTFELSCPHYLSPFACQAGPPFSHLMVGFQLRPLSLLV